MKEIILVTGAAGFIGFYVSQRLLDDGYEVVGIDNLNDYYDIKLKETRLNIIKRYVGFSFYQIDISDKEKLEKVFKMNNIKYVIHLAAQAGVRYSIENPDAYIQSNIVGTYNILEMCRFHPVKHLVYASSSSVYGANKKVPFEETDFVDHPVSLYAATKKSNELMAHAYSNLYKIPSTGLRFFTVYGPMGRPDMAYFTFVEKYFKDESIKIFNNGNFERDMQRDFTYIDDIVEGVFKILHTPPKNPNQMHRLFNIGNSNPIKLMDFILILESCLSNSLGRKVEFKKRFESIKPGDVQKTYASTKKLERLTNYKPSSSVTMGLQKFTDWFIEYYNNKY
jgi:UDP-glucuronate 4-epimerase